MTWLEALILGLIQGLTEFLPVSSSGHLAIAQSLFGIDAEQNLMFTVLVHFATVLATFVVFFSDIKQLFIGLFKFKWNIETKYICMLLISAIPVAIVGFCFKDTVEALFSKMWIIATALIVTAILLVFAHFSNKIFKNRQSDKALNFCNASLIGLSQAIAVIPGLSRSGTTISTGLLLGVKREELAKFSFLMVMIPVLGEAFLDIVSGGFVSAGISILPLCIGFCAAFVSGLLACKLMIEVVKRVNLLWFALYCLIAAGVAFCCC
jgi:undecaprenyl-diphosphatase